MFSYDNSSNESARVNAKTVADASSQAHSSLCSLMHHSYPTKLGNPMVRRCADLAVIPRYGRHARDIGLLCPFRGTLELSAFRNFRLRFQECVTFD